MEENTSQRPFGEKLCHEFIKGVLQRIRAPSLIMTADKSALQSVEKVRQYQRLIPDSRLVVLDSDAYHIAAANADECVSNVLAFIRQSTQKT